MESSQSADRFFSKHILSAQSYQPGEQPGSNDFIKLNTNENPYPCSERVVEAITAAARAGLQRYPESTALNFRRTAAEQLGVEPDWILCGNGSDEILTIVTRSFVTAQGEIRTPFPTYVLYPILAKIQGATHRSMAFDSDWQLPRNFAAEQKNLRLVFLANPNSPSGTMITSEAVAELAQSLDCPLLIDEAYVDFAGESCVELVKQHSNVMVSRTLSKSYALAGLRFGYLVAQPEVIAHMNKVRDSYNCDALSVAGATAAISDTEWLSENVARVIKARDKLSHSLHELGFDVTPSEANFVWCTHRSGRHQEIYQRLKDRQILIRHLAFEGWGDGLRVSVGTEQQMETFLAAIQAVLD